MFKKHTLGDLARTSDLGISQNVLGALASTSDLDCGTLAGLNVTSEGKQTIKSNMFDIYDLG